jgi:hypothetical protein
MERLARDLQVTIQTVRTRKIVEKGLESVQIRAEKAENARKHREKCQKYAEMVKNREISLKKAAFEVGISERQFRRWLAKIEDDKC